MLERTLRYTVLARSQIVAKRFAPARRRFRLSAHGPAGIGRPGPYSADARSPALSRPAVLRPPVDFLAFTLMSYRRLGSINGMIATVALTSGGLPFFFAEK